MPNRDAGMMAATRTRWTPWSRFLFAMTGLAVAMLAIYASGLDPLQWVQDHLPSSTPVAHLEKARRHGPIAAGEPNPIGTDSSVSKVPRRLLLTSTRLGQNATKGYASIGIDATSPQVYRAGALLANGTRIAQVFSDHIVLERDGQRELLYVTGKEPPGYRAPDTSLLTVGGRPPAAPAAATSHDALTDVIRVNPIYDGDGVKAIEVYANARSDGFSKLGLQAGDRIVAIDGEPVQSTAKALDSLRAIAQGAALQVTIDRHGERQQMALDGIVLQHQ